jgi:hypothetical protein
MARKTTEELIAEEEKRAEQARVRMVELKSRQKLEERRRDNHRKIITGAGIMAHIKIDPRFRKAVQDALNKAITGPKHRAAIPDMLDEQVFQEAMRAEARKADAEAKEAQQEVSRGADKEPASPTRPEHQERTAREIQRPAPG